MLFKFVRNLKYIAPAARKKCVAEMLRLFGKWILLFPLLLFYTITLYPLTLFTMFVIAGMTVVKEARERLTPIYYWRMDGIFNWFHLKFTCKDCGKKVSYDASFKELENEYQKNGLLWSWFSPTERLCYNCSRSNTDNQDID